MLPLESTRSVPTMVIGKAAAKVTLGTVKLYPGTGGSGGGGGVGGGAGEGVRGWEGAGCESFFLSSNPSRLLKNVPILETLSVNCTGFCMPQQPSGKHGNH